MYKRRYNPKRYNLSRTVGFSELVIPEDDYFGMTGFESAKSIHNGTRADVPKIDEHGHTSLMSVFCWTSKRIKRNKILRSVRGYDCYLVTAKDRQGRKRNRVRIFN